MDGLASRLATVTVALGLTVGAARAQNDAPNAFFPDFYKEAGVSTDRTPVEEAPPESIDPFTGALALVQQDLVIPGPAGFDLTVVRAYATHQDFDDLGTAATSWDWSYVGLGWTLHWGRLIAPFGGCANGGSTDFYLSDNPVFEGQDGHRQLFFRADASLAPAQLVSREGWRADCLLPGGGWRVWSPNGTRFDLTFVKAGSGQSVAYYATTIEDRNGNAIRVEYGADAFGDPYVLSVTGDDGRQVTLTYFDEHSASRRLATVRGEGRETLYEYQPTTLPNRYLLSRVVRPDGSAWEYAYNDNAATTVGRWGLANVTHPNGGRIAYTYRTVLFDRRRQTGATALKTTAVATKEVLDDPQGTWSFAYEPATGANELDTTTVTLPGGKTVYEHYGIGTVASGDVWRVGLVASISHYTGSTLEETTTYTWAGRKISSERYYRPSSFFGQVLSLFDEDAFAPRLATRAIQRDGSVFKTEYSNADLYGNPQQVVETGPTGATRTTTLTYFTNPTAWIVQGFRQNETLSAGAITREYETNGNMRVETRFGRRIVWEYDAAGDIAAITNPRGTTIRWKNYFRGTAQTIERPEGVTERRVVNGDGTVASETNGRAYTTRYKYDGLGRPTEIDPPAGETTTIVYSQRRKTLTRGTHREQTDLDAFGRPTAITRDGIKTTYLHDALGRTIFESYPGRTEGTQTTYDALDRPTLVRHPDGTSRAYEYLNGNRVTVRNERGNATTYAFQSFGEPEDRAVVETAAPLGQTTAIGRNAIGIMDSVSQGGKTRTYGYDARYYLTSLTHPEIGTVAYGRDANGNMTSRTVGNATTTFVYDGLDRLTTIHYPGATSRDVTISWDENGNPKRISNGLAVWEYEYTPNDVLQRETLTIHGRTFVVQYAIDGLDHVVSVTYPSGRRVDYAPDSRGRPTQATPYVTSVTWHPEDQPESLTLANGRAIRFALDQRRWLERIFTPQERPGQATDLSYPHDGVGNVTAIADAVDPTHALTMTYDALDRLATAVGATESARVTHDTRGNLQTYELGTERRMYTYAAASDRLLSVTGGARSFVFDYDGYGNVTSDGVATYEWDDAGHLLAIPEADRLYDYDGNDHQVSVSRADGTRWTVVYDRAGRLLGEYSESAASLCEYVYVGTRVVARTCQ